MPAFPLLSDAYARALEPTQEERERRLRRSNGGDPFARIPDDEDDEDDEGDEEEVDLENAPTRPLRLDRLHL